MKSSREIAADAVGAAVGAAVGLALGGLSGGPLAAAAGAVVGGVIGNLLEKLASRPKPPHIAEPQRRTMPAPEPLARAVSPPVLGPSGLSPRESYEFVESGRRLVPWIGLVVLPFAALAVFHPLLNGVFPGGDRIGHLLVGGAAGLLAGVVITRFAKWTRPGVWVATASATLPLVLAVAVLRSRVPGLSAPVATSFPSQVGTSLYFSLMWAAGVIALLGVRAFGERSTLTVDGFGLTTLARPSPFTWSRTVRLAWKDLAFVDLRPADAGAMFLVATPGRSAAWHDIPDHLVRRRPTLHPGAIRIANDWRNTEIWLVDVTRLSDSLADLDAALAQHSAGRYRGVASSS